MAIAEFIPESHRRTPLCGYCEKTQYRVTFAIKRNFLIEVFVDGSQTLSIFLFWQELTPSVCPEVIDETLYVAIAKSQYRVIYAVKRNFLIKIFVCVSQSLFIVLFWQELAPSLCPEVIDETLNVVIAKIQQGVTFAITRNFSVKVFVYVFWVFSIVLYWY